MSSDTLRASPRIEAGGGAPAPGAPATGAPADERRERGGEGEGGKGGKKEEEGTSADGGVGGVDDGGGPTGAAAGAVLGRKRKAEEDDGGGGEEKKTGNAPSQHRYKGLPVPYWFRPRTADAFRSMEMRDSDVVLSSLVKGGTTWVHSIVYSLLHRFDDCGAVRGGSEGAIGSSGQSYPDALPLDGRERAACLAERGHPLHHANSLFGDYTFDDLLRQTEPRLFSTHLFGPRFLPSGLLGGRPSPPGRGRLIVVLRNLKDALVSLYFWRGLPADGWLGNGNGPGLYSRFLEEDCLNAFGSTFDWVRETNEAVERLQDQVAKCGGKQRVLVVYYEALKLDLEGQLDRISSFLGLGQLTAAKRDAVARAVDFSNMKANAQGKQKTLLRKGVMGDWHNHLTPKHWEEFDKVFESKLGDVGVAQPLRQYQ